MEAGNQRIAVKKPFRYECVWERDARFKDVVEAAWNGDGPASSVMELANKLQSVATSLSRWGWSSFGSVRQEQRLLRRKLAMLRADPMRTGPSEEERKVEERMVELAYQEEIMARQRSRITWLSEGDSNTKFFQRKASARRAKNSITQLDRADGTTCTDPAELANMSTEFYSNLYT